MQHTTIGDVLREHRRSHPGRTALVDGPVRLTWPELDDRVNRLAGSLAAAGLGRGDRIMWLGQNSFRVYELIAAAGKLGAMVCVGYWRWAPPEMEFALRDFDPHLVVWQHQEIHETVARTREALGSDDTARWLRHDSAPQDPDGYEAFLAAGGLADPDLDIDPDSPVLVLYTAAMSGRQCGSLLSHTNLIAMATAAAWLGDIDHTTAFLNSGPMFHIGNYQFWGMPTLLMAGKNVIVRRVVAEEVRDLLVAEECTHAFLMPPTVAEIVRLNRGTGHDLSRLRATVAPHLWEGMATTDTSRFTRSGGAAGRGYGQTELSGFAVTAAYGGPAAGNAGRPGPGLTVRILDTEGRECAVGEAGEICARGTVVHRGYWNRDEVNAHRFRSGWWHTTDLGRREPDGSITFLGTTTRMLKSAAENIFPAEVENCIEQHPAVREAAVIGVPNTRWAQDVKAVVVLEPDAGVSEQEIIDHCRPRIASYKKPKSVEFTAALPRTVSGARDYDALDKEYGGGGYPGSATLGPGR
ncbi:AMP-binding protein [Streptomyces hygroscopicus]|uniref:AMP-binding protein n=1 Tax=Streptomyces hygroscopicus TaxID=1912 RepID=UPI001FCBA089|nr:AMP-binding protein [Streptomyces hygroscopicus]BDH09658.1 long-chain acyl-CoA synthetase [Streptomyces hygroscopicus]